MRVSLRPPSAPAPPPRTPAARAPRLASPPGRGRWACAVGADSRRWDRPRVSWAVGMRVRIPARGGGARSGLAGVCGGPFARGPGDGGWCSHAASVRRATTSRGGRREQGLPSPRLVPSSGGAGTPKPWVASREVPGPPTTGNGVRPGA